MFQSQYFLTEFRANSELITKRAVRKSSPEEKVLDPSVMLFVYYCLSQPCTKRALRRRWQVLNHLSHNITRKTKRFRKKTETYNLKRESFSMDPQLQQDVDPDGKKGHHSMSCQQKQYHASLSETPTDNRNNRQASSRAVLPSVPFVYSRPVAPEKKQ